MGRPRKYENPAQRQAAYRARLAAGETRVIVDRRTLEALEARVRRLHEAVLRAARAGNPLAKACDHAHDASCLDALADAFEAISEGREPVRRVR